MKDEIFTDKQTGKNYWMSQIVDMSADLNGFKDTTVKKDNSNHPIKEKPLEVENEYYTEFLYHGQ